MTPDDRVSNMMESTGAALDALVTELNEQARDARARIEAAAQSAYVPYRRADAFIDRNTLPVLAGVALAAGVVGFLLGRR